MPSHGHGCIQLHGHDKSDLGRQQVRDAAYGRSSYIAAAMPNSGGQGGYPMNMILQDPTHVPAAMTMHGARGADVSLYANGLPASYPRYCMIVTKDTPMPAPAMTNIPCMPMR